MSAFATTETQTVFTDSSQALETKVLDESQRFKELSCYTIQASSAQDFVTTGTYNPSECTDEDSSDSKKISEESFDFIVVADSHGGQSSGNKTFYTDLFKLINWGKLLAGRDGTAVGINWQRHIKKLTTSGNYGITDTYRLGTTLTIWKIYTDRFECYWIGDSSAKLYSENKIIFKTKDHDYNNEEEIQRIISNGGTSNPAWDIAMKNKNTLLSVRGKTIGIGNDKINMSRALGHRGSFLKEYGSSTSVEWFSPFDYQVIPRDANKSYKIVTGSDGFWQMTCDEDNNLVSDISNTSRELALEARRRWEATWNWDNSLGEIQENVKLPEDNIDDICVATWSFVC
tara:strand:- start:391 stop:1419 length:1029 start_codon:yes stop_codon:yes gene_type:complete